MILPIPPPEWEAAGFVFGVVKGNTTACPSRFVPELNQIRINSGDEPESNGEWLIREVHPVPSPRD